jgi:SAM-dependent methyltransferase
MRQDGGMTSIEPSSSQGRAAHWDEVYARTGGQGVSWFEDEPRTSLSMLARLPIRWPQTSVVDVGGGASALVDALIGRGARAVNVVDVSDEGMAVARRRLGASAEAAQWVVADVTAWRPDEPVEVWHDRAVFHFLVEPADRAGYVAALRAGLRPGGYAVIATFAEDGPTSCSSLPTARYDADGLVAALGPGFTEVLRDRRVHVTPSGGDQPFTWVVLERDGGQRVEAGSDASDASDGSEPS